MTEVEIREVPVPVRTPLPTECFVDHVPAPTFAADGPLTIRQLDMWAEELASVIDRYAAQAARCRELNDQRE